MGDRVAGEGVREFGVARTGAGLAVTCGFIVRVSTPSKAIVYGSGLMPLTGMIRAGILPDLTAVITAWAGLTIFTPILPR